MAQPAVQRWLAWFPLTRGISRRHAMAAFDLNAGFVYSQILAATVEVGLLPALRAGPVLPGDIGHVLGLTPARTLLLLRACAAIGLVVPAGDGRYELAMRGAILLGNAGAVRMVQHHALLYRDLADPVALLRAEQPDTALRRFWNYGQASGTDRDEDGVRDGAASAATAYSALMAGSLGMLVDDVLEVLPLRGARALLDLGGGEGAFLEAVAARQPRLALTLFDLPDVAARARVRLAPLGARATVVGGDAFNAPLPGPQDIVSLVRVLHDHDDEPALALLVAAWRALRPGGTVVVAEPLAGTQGAERMGDAYFGFYLLAMGQGRPRTAEELRGMLAAAGFVDIQRRRTRRPMLTSVLLARRPTAAA